MTLFSHSEEPNFFQVPTWYRAGYSTEMIRMSSSSIRQESR